MKKISLLSILCLTIFSLTGCWGNKYSFQTLLSGTENTSYSDNTTANDEMVLQDSFTPDYSDIKWDENINVITNDGSETTEASIAETISIDEIRDLHFMESQGTVIVSDIINGANAIKNRDDIKYVESFVEGNLINENIDITFGVPFTANIQKGDDLFIKYKVSYDNDKTYITDIQYIGNNEPYNSFEQNPDEIIIDENQEQNNEEIIKIDADPQEQEIEEIQKIEENINNNEELDNAFTVIDGVNVRDKASTKGKILGELKPGTIINVIEVSANSSWAKFNYNGQEAWVSTKYIKKGN